MKVSVSLPADDVAFLDRYAAEHGIASRSAALQRAVQLLRTTGLGAAYEDAWSDWEHDGEAALWESTSVDGLAVTGLVRDSKARAEQVRSLAVELVGSLDASLVDELNEALRLHLPI